MFDPLNKLLRLRIFLDTQLERRPWIILAALITVSTVIFSAFSILRYAAFQTNFFDLGLYSNSIWRTVNGYDSWSSLLLPSTPGHINHISPVMVLPAIAYAIVPNPITLLVLQAVVVSVAAIPLYLLGLRETRNQFVSISLSGLYLLNPGLHGIVRFDFHLESFIPLFIFLLYFSYYRPGGLMFYASTALLLSTIEYSAVLGIGMAAVFWVAKRHLDQRILVLLGSSLGLLLVIILSTVGATFQSINWPSNWLAVQFFGSSSAQSSSFSQWFSSLWSNPGVLFSSIQYDAFVKLTYFVIVTTPLWFAIFRYSIRMIPAVPWLAIVVATSKFSFTHFDFQYTAFVIPFVYLAAIPFLRRLTGMIRFRRIVLGLIVISLCTMTIYSSVSPLGPRPWPQPSPLATTIASLDGTIPQNATLLTQSDLFPQVSNRPYVTLNYSSTAPPQYILVNTSTVWYDSTNPSLGYPFSAHAQLDYFTSHFSYKLVFTDQGVELYKLAS
jgi:uncharacterized membrane protein